MHPQLLSWEQEGGTLENNEVKQHNQKSGKGHHLGGKEKNFRLQELTQAYITALQSVLYLMLPEVTYNLTSSLTTI